MIAVLVNESVVDVVAVAVVSQLCVFFCKQATVFVLYCSMSCQSIQSPLQVSTANDVNQLSALRNSVLDRFSS